MLSEIPNVRQIEGEPFRRWFSDNNQDLIVWYNACRKIIGFQLCYGKRTIQKALTWLGERGYSHNNVDDGETTGYGFKRSPILVPDGVFNKRNVLLEFIESSTQIDPEICIFVIRTINRYK